MLFTIFQRKRRRRVSNVVLHHRDCCFECTDLTGCFFCFSQLLPLYLTPHEQPQRYLRLTKNSEFSKNHSNISTLMLVCPSCFYKAHFSSRCLWIADFQILEGRFDFLAVCFLIFSQKMQKKY